MYSFPQTVVLLLKSHKKKISRLQKAYLMKGKPNLSLIRKKSDQSQKNILLSEIALYKPLLKPYKCKI